MTRVCVVGAGVVGLSCSWSLARAGCDVTLVDPEPGRGASDAAAGMLAPVSEVTPGESVVLRFGLESLRQWPDFAAALEAHSGVGVGYRRAGTLLVAHDRDDATDLDRFAAYLARHGLAAEQLSGRQVRALEPALSARTVSGLHVSGDHSVDNRAVVRALLRACDGAGVRLVPARGTLVFLEGRACGVRALGQVLPADVVVVAAGYASASLVPSPTPGGAPAEGAAPVGLGDLLRPVKGQILRLTGPVGLLQHTVRARVGGEHVYLVPRDGAEVVVGATSEDVGEDTRVTADGIHRLLHAALSIVPSVADMALHDVMAGLRPASPDNAPLVGALGPGLVLATAHFRGGVLMAPATARAVTDLVLERPVEPLVGELSPGRFARALVPSIPVEAGP